MRCRHCDISAQVNLKCFERKQDMMKEDARKKRNKKVKAIEDFMESNKLPSGMVLTLSYKRDIDSGTHVHTIRNVLVDTE